MFAKAFAFAIFLLAFLTFWPYAIIAHGTAGLVAAIIWTVIMLAGFAGSIAGEGMLGGLVGVVGGWLVYVLAVTFMALFEWYSVLHHEWSDMMDANFMETCFGAKVINATSGYFCWVYGIASTDHPYFTPVCMILCVVGIIAGVISKIIARN